MDNNDMPEVIWVSEGSGSGPGRPLVIKTRPPMLEGLFTEYTRTDTIPDVAELREEITALNQVIIEQDKDVAELIEAVTEFDIAIQNQRGGGLSAHAQAKRMKVREALSALKAKVK